MKISNINESLSLVANIGVLVGIIFLAVELRQNSNIAQADSYRQIIADIGEWRNNINNNPRLLSLFIAYRDDHNFQEMNTAEQTQVAFMINNLFGSYESAYYSREYGLISGSEWQRLESTACNHFRLAALNQYNNVNFITPEFSNFLSVTC